MSVWLTIPSALPPDRAMACLSKWTAKGYKVAVLRDDPAPLPVDLQVTSYVYPGYAVSVNMLAAAVLRLDPDCDWIVVAGDDVHPDPNHDPHAIATECSGHFGGSLGIMQPTGDHHMVDGQGRCAAERCAVTPWIGREWCERGYEGNGPLWGPYRHEGVDLDLHHVAMRLGLLWHRPDLMQFHDWWGRRHEPPPEHMRDKTAWNTEGNRLFAERLAAGFPGSGVSNVTGQLPDTAGGEPRNENQS